MFGALTCYVPEWFFLTIVAYELTTALDYLRTINDFQKIRVVS